MTNKSARPVAPYLMPIAGIGASAGGLDPICEFLVSVPPERFKTAAPEMAEGELMFNAPALTIRSR